MVRSLQLPPNPHILVEIMPMKKVIIAEDLRAIVEKEKNFLDRSDVRIFTAATNEKALSLHKAQKVDLIIAKLDSPDMSGEMLCSHIREDPELQKVSLIIVCSATEADLERCVKCRANAFITSPINDAVLLEEAHQLLHIAPRTSSRIPVSVKLRGTSKKTPFIGFAENISTSGMLFRAAAVLYEGDIIKCSFSLPGFTHITVDAEIVRVLAKERRRDINGYGVKFVDLSATAISTLEAFVKKENEDTK